MNRGSKQTVESKREAFSQSQRCSQLSLLQQSKRRLTQYMSTQQIMIRVQISKDKVDHLLQRLDIPHASYIEIEIALNQLMELSHLLDEDESKFVMIDDIMRKISRFHDVVLKEYNRKNQTPFLVLVYYSENVLSKINPLYIRTVAIDDILKLFTDQQYKELSRDFLIRNVRNTKLWCQALQKQGFDFTEDEELLETLVQLLDKEYAWELINMKKQIPFNQQICKSAWKALRMPEVRKFVLGQISNQDQYYEEFIKFGIHEALTVFLDQNWQGNRITEHQLEQILFCVKLILIIDPQEKPIQGLLESRVLEKLARIQIHMFNERSLFILYEIFNKIDQQPQLSKCSLLDCNWYEKFFQILIYQQASELIVNHAIEKIKLLTSQRKFDNQAVLNISKIMNDYEEYMNQEQRFYEQIQKQ